ncbi:hypothetical protein DPMN_140916 [Dreissena polymorpha]|uniref:Uncharacterized protein n=1 Tax=Dreissena polymorpha TaxID=45954 RepID=A0A9D4JM55_DREPO|nr:hypothetical protein DPMN_140916 [Dreissena polymorpha]
MIPTLLGLDILKNKGDQTKLPQLIKDSFKIFTNGIYQCNRKRKSIINAAVPARYKKVCDLDIPVTSNLFGDNIDSKVEEIEKEEKKSQKFTSSPFYTSAMLQGAEGLLIHTSSKPVNPSQKTKVITGKAEVRVTGGNPRLSLTGERDHIRCKSSFAYEQYTRYVSRWKITTFYIRMGKKSHLTIGFSKRFVVTN